MKHRLRKVLRNTCFQFAWFSLIWKRILQTAEKKLRLWAGSILRWSSTKSDHRAWLSFLLNHRRAIQGSNKAICILKSWSKTSAVPPLRLKNTTYIDAFWGEKVRDFMKKDKNILQFYCSIYFKGCQVPPKYRPWRRVTPSVILSEGCVATESKFCGADISQHTAAKCSRAKPRAQRMAARSGICKRFLTRLFAQTNICLWSVWDCFEMITKAQETLRKPITDPAAIRLWRIFALLLYSVSCCATDTSFRKSSTTGCALRSGWHSGDAYIWIFSWQTTRFGV